MKISILVDNIDSWFDKYAVRLKISLASKGHDVVYVNNGSELEGGDICFLLSCTRIVGAQILTKYKHNIVIHASDLPKGKGFTPFKWQVLEGKNDIILTLFEAAEAVDAGDYYFKDSLHFEGYELLAQMQDALGRKICEMAERYVEDYETMLPHPQKGTETIYARRTVKDDELDVKKTIEQQMNLLRIADNDRYPLWFQYMGHEYVIKIYPKEKKE